MPSVPCKISILCPGSDDPISNYSSEVPDVIEFAAIGYPIFNPSNPLGDDPRDPLNPFYAAEGCVSLCTSRLSLQDAQDCAARQAYECESSGRNPPPNQPAFFTNDPQSCTIPCPNGGPGATVVVPSGTVIAPSAGLANAIAHNLACQRAAQGIVTVENEEQCFTAHCTTNDQFVATRCTPAGTYGECLLSPTPAQLLAAQTFYNDFALAAATADANAALAAHVCQTCNAEISGFAACPGDPTKISHATVPAGKYCVAPGGSQSNVDMQAQQDLYNQLQAGLSALGCACTSSLNRTSQIFTYACDTFIQVLTLGGSAFPAPLNGNPPGSGIFHIAPGGTFDWNALWQANIGGITPPARILGISYTAPEVRIYVP